MGPISLGQPQPVTTPVAKHCPIAKDPLALLEGTLLYSDTADISQRNIQDPKCREAMTEDIIESICLLSPFSSPETLASSKLHARHLARCKRPVDSLIIVDVFEVLESPVRFRPSLLSG